MQASEEPLGDIGTSLAEATAVVDVRTPAEFAKGAVAGAHNIPLFDNAERSEIGTLYKQIGKQEAIQAGLNFVGGRLAGFIEQFEPYRAGRLLVYCARGGMRSQSVVSLLSSLGYPASQLPGGYKAFRNYLLGALEKEMPPRPIVLHGRTGVGKTLLLARLDNALDLEDLAQHRSSLFGAVNLRPRTQQHFEALLLRALGGLDFAEPVWIEGESRKVGDAILPEALRRAMQAGLCVLVTASLGTRVRRIIEEYSGNDPAETLPQLEAALISLTRFIGKQTIARLVDCLRGGDLPTVVETLLVDYYDPRYLHGMRDYRYALEVSSEDLDEAAGQLRAFAFRAPSDPPRAAAVSYDSASGR